MAKPKQALGPLDWTIFTVPSDVPEVAFAVLRRNYDGHRNDARVYAHAKLHPKSRPSSILDWQPQVRHEVLLPADADDRLLDARVLLEDFEADQVPGQRDLVTHVKLTPAKVGRLHAFWEQGRRFAHEEFVAKEQLAVLIIQHAPPLGDCHLHLLVLPRRLGLRGWGRFATELACDAGCKRVGAAWLAFKAAR